MTFFIACVGVGVLATLDLTCPICEGTGTLLAAQGLTLKGTSITLVSETPVYTFGECGTPVKRSKFTYSVNMSLANGNNGAARGTVKVIFSRHPPGFEVFVIDPEGIQVVQEYMPPTVPAYVSVPAGTTRTIATSLTYIDDPLLPGDPAPRPAIEAGVDMTDPTCGGIGILSFVDWIGAKLKPPSFE